MHWSGNFYDVNLRIKHWSPSSADLRINLILFDIPCWLHEEIRKIKRCFSHYKVSTLDIGIKCCKYFLNSTQFLSFFRILKILRKIVDFCFRTKQLFGMNNEMIEIFITFNNSNETSDAWSIEWNLSDCDHVF